MPTPRSKPTDPEITKAAIAMAWQHLYRLCIDVASWSDQGVVAHPGSRRKHAVEFIRGALDPDVTSDSMRKIAHDVAHPIIAQDGSPGRPGDARRNQIIVDAIEAVCKAHDLHPTRRTGEAESGCSIVAMAIEQFIAGCHNPQLDELSHKIFPEGPLSEDRLETIWRKRTVREN
jgi:hypothetical protein